MRKLYNLLFILISVSCIGQNQLAIPTYSNIFYGDSTYNWLNIYLTQSNTPTAVYIWAHGNGTNSFPVTANHFPEDVCNDLKDNNISLISWESIGKIENIEDFNKAQNDFYLVMDWVYENAEIYNIDTNKIVVGGRSRGSIISWAYSHEKFKKIKGIYSVQAFPDDSWAFKNFKEDIQSFSPDMFLTYFSTPTSNDGHNPANGEDLVKKYENIGLDNASIYHSLPLHGIYDSLATFINRVTEKNTIEGFVVYNNEFQHKMPFFEIQLINYDNNIVKKIITDSIGYFYGRLTPKEYIISTNFNTSNTGINSTDALLTQRHFLFLDTLLDLSLEASDINYSGNINSTDAILIRQIYLDQNYNNSTNWIINPAYLDLNQNNQFTNILYRQRGDVNGSYSTY